jgi:hypothetical protein
MWFENEIFSFEKMKMKVKGKHWNYLLNKSIMTVETSNHWKYQIWAWDDEQIFDFVTNDIDVIVLPVGAVMAYHIIPKSPLPNKWSNQKQSFHARFKCRKWVDHYKYVTNLTCSQS